MVGGSGRASKFFVVREKQELEESEGVDGGEGCLAHLEECL